MTTLAVLQPGYLPWLGFFDQVRRCDVFVFYDDVQFDKHGWRNRNRIKTANGPVWLTVPVLHKGRMGQLVHQVEVDGRQDWARRHLRGIEQAYAKAPFASRYLPQLADLLNREWALLAELDIALTRMMCGWFGIDRPMHRSSQLDVEGDRNARLVALCRAFGARRYLSGNAAKSYLDVALFEAEGIAVEWQDFDHPVYPQLHGPFEAHMSALDCVLNTGPECAQILSAGGSAAEAS